MVGPNGDREVIQGGGSARRHPHRRRHGRRRPARAAGRRRDRRAGLDGQPRARRRCRAPTSGEPTARRASTWRSSAPTASVRRRLRPRDFRVVFLDDPATPPSVGWSARVSASYTAAGERPAPLQGQDQRRGDAHGRRRGGRRRGRADRGRAGAAGAGDAARRSPAAPGRRAPVRAAGAGRRLRAGGGRRPGGRRRRRGGRARRRLGDRGPRPRVARAAGPPGRADRGGGGRPAAHGRRRCWPARRSTCRGPRSGAGDPLGMAARPGGRAGAGRRALRRRRARGPPAVHAARPASRTRPSFLDADPGVLRYPEGVFTGPPLVRRPRDRAGVPVRVRPRLHHLGHHHAGGAGADRRRARAPRCDVRVANTGDRRRPVRGAALRRRSRVPRRPGRSASCEPSRRWRWTPARPASSPSSSGMRDLARWDRGAGRVGGGCRRAPRVGRHLVARPRRAGHPRAHRALDVARLGVRSAPSSVEAGAPDRATPLRRPGVRRRPGPARARDGPGAVRLPRRPVGAGGGVPADRRPPPDVGAALVAVRPGAHVARRPARGLGRRRRDRGRPHRRRAGLRAPRGRHRVRDRLARAGRRRPATPRRRRGAGGRLAGRGERAGAAPRAGRHRRRRRPHLGAGRGGVLVGRAAARGGGRGADRVRGRERLAGRRHRRPPRRGAGVVGRRRGPDAARPHVGRAGRPPGHPRRRPLGPRRGGRAALARRPGRAGRPGWQRPTSRCAAPTAPSPPSCSTPGTRPAPTGSRTVAMGDDDRVPVQRRHRARATSPCPSPAAGCRWS